VQRRNSIKFLKINEWIMMLEASKMWGWNVILWCC